MHLFFYVQSTLKTSVKPVEYARWSLSNTSIKAGMKNYCFAKKQLLLTDPLAQCQEQHPPDEDLAVTKVWLQIPNNDQKLIIL